jgi:hypothetical protein
MTGKYLGIALCAFVYISTTTFGSALPREDSTEPVFIETGEGQPNGKGIQAGCLPLSIKQQLTYIGRTYGPVTIISGYRPGARIAGTRRPSYHASCQAVDFKVRGKGAQSRAVQYLKKNWSGGVGTYSGCMSHVHIDTGYPVRYHHVVNCRGRKKR